MKREAKRPRSLDNQSRSTVYALLSVVAFGFAGCTLATQQDILKLDDDLNHLRKNQADLVAKMTDLGGNLEGLNSQLESSQQRMSTLSQKLDDLQADLSHRFNVLSGQVTGTTTQGASTPGDMFRLAYNDYQAGKFDLALVGFRNFMSQYPKAEVSPQAQFYIGECEFALKNWSDAAREYAKVVDFFPKTEFEPKALYKRALALQQVGHTDEARGSLQRLLKEHPHHELAKSARDILSE